MEALPPDIQPDFRRHFDTHYTNHGVTFEEIAPAYQFGYDMANDPKFHGRKFHDVEDEIKQLYAERYPDSQWETIWDALFFGWERAGGEAGGWGFI